MKLSSQCSQVNLSFSFYSLPSPSPSSQINPLFFVSTKGMCVGAIVRIAPGHVVQSMIAFKSTILLNVLLPPIILNSGYQLKQVNVISLSQKGMLLLTGGIERGIFLGELLSKFRSHLDVCVCWNFHFCRCIRVTAFFPLSPLLSC